MPETLATTIRLLHMVYLSHLVSRRRKLCSMALVGLAQGYDAKVDMWSGGVIPYNLLPLAPPFDDDGFYDKILAVSYIFDAEGFDTVPQEAIQRV
jgi:serine/threonine protein kinase